MTYLSQTLLMSDIVSDYSPTDESLTFQMVASFFPRTGSNQTHYDTQSEFVCFTVVLGNDYFGIITTEAVPELSDYFLRNFPGLRFPRKMYNLETCPKIGQLRHNPCF